MIWHLILTDLGNPPLTYHVYYCSMPIFLIFFFLDGLLLEEEFSYHSFWLKRYIMLKLLWHFWNLTIFKGQTSTPYHPNSKKNKYNAELHRTSRHKFSSSNIVTILSLGYNIVKYKNLPQCTNYFFMSNVVSISMSKIMTK